MINGVLVERTVKEVVPALQTNSEGLKKVLEELIKQYKTKQDDMEKWKVCFFESSHNLRLSKTGYCPGLDNTLTYLQKKNNIQVVQQQ